MEEAIKARLSQSSHHGKPQDRRKEFMHKLAEFERRTRKDSLETRDTSRSGINRHAARDHCPPTNTLFFLS